MCTQSEQVDEEPRSSDPGHHGGALDLMRLGEALDSLEDDGEAQSREEDGVDQSPHHLRPDPPEGVFVCRMGFFRESYGDQRVRQHRQRGGNPADHHFHYEKAKSQ
uniref:Uncharacterized protein n=1 Tax=Sphaeramia orbicularis TaxID=375764 RepID=A0A673BFK7_9TELE